MCDPPNGISNAVRSTSILNAVRTTSISNAVQTISISNAVRTTSISMPCRSLPATPRRLPTESEREARLFYHLVITRLLWGIKGAWCAGCTCGVHVPMRRYACCEGARAVHGRVVGLGVGDKNTLAQMQALYVRGLI
jgi:hypothetical protein